MNILIPKTRGELKRNLQEGITCKVVTSNVEITSTMLEGWLNFTDFEVILSDDEGWSLFIPTNKGN